MTTEIREGARKAFSAIRQAHPEETINAYALHRDSGAMTLMHCANSRQRIRDVDEAYVWNCQEWFFDEGGEFLDIAYRLIRTRHEDLPSEVKWEDFIEGFDESCIRALEQLIEEGFFGTRQEREDVVILYQLSDLPTEQAEATRRLNTKTMYQRYRKWWDSWNEPTAITQSRERDEELEAASGAVTGTTAGTESSMAVDPVEEFEQAMAESDWGRPVDVASRYTGDKFRNYLIEQAELALTDYIVSKQGAERCSSIFRLRRLVLSLGAHNDRRTIRFIKNTFDRRAEFQPVRGRRYDMPELIQDLATRLVAHGSKPALRHVAMTHPEFTSEYTTGLLPVCFVAGVWSMSAKRVYEEFSPYLRQKSRSRAAWERKKIISDLVSGMTRDGFSLYMQRTLARPADAPKGFWTERPGGAPNVDPRWLDAAIDADEIGSPYLRNRLIDVLARPGHARLSEYLLQKYNRLSRDKEDPLDVIDVMKNVGHPDALDCCMRSAEQFGIWDRDDEGYTIQKYAATMSEFPQASEMIDEWINARPAKDRMYYRDEIEAQRKWHERQRLKKKRNEESDR